MRLHFSQVTQGITSSCLPPTSPPPRFSSPPPAAAPAAAATISSKQQQAAAGSSMQRQAGASSSRQDQIHFPWCLLTIQIPFSQCQLSAIFDFLSSASLSVDCLLKFFRPGAGNHGNIQIPRPPQSSDPANCMKPGIPKNLKNRMIPGILGTNESRKSRKSWNPRILGIPIFLFKFLFSQKTLALIFFLSWPIVF